MNQIDYQLDQFIKKHDFKLVLLSSEFNKCGDDYPRSKLITIICVKSDERYNLFKLRLYRGKKYRTFIVGVKEDKPPTIYVVLRCIALIERMIPHLAKEFKKSIAIVNGFMGDIFQELLESQ